MQQNCGIKTQCDIKHGRWPTIVNAPCERRKTAAGCTARNWRKCERPPFARQKATFYTPKGHLLEPERTPFATRWQPGCYAGGFLTPFKTLP